MAININPFYKGQAQARQAMSGGKKASPERLAMLAASRAVPRVRVEPTREELRHVLKHPNGMRFRSEGSVEWPLDRFTQRRLRDGDIKIVTEEKKEEKPAAHHSARRHSAE